MTVRAAAAAAATADDPRVRDALRRATIARIVTVTASGGPLIMPLYFVLLDGRIHMNNAATSPTVRNIASHPHVLLLFEGGDGEVVKVRGTKYVLRPRALWFALRNLSRVRPGRGTPASARIRGRSR